MLCRGRPDYIVRDKEGGLHLVDLKTTRDASKGLFSREIMRHQYHIQLAFYHDGIVQATGQQPQSINIVAVEKTAPYECFCFPVTISGLNMLAVKSSLRFVGLQAIGFSQGTLRK